MANDNFKALYQQIVQKLAGLNQSHNSETGRLYKTIRIIVGEEQSQSLRKTREVCDYFGIKSDSSIEEDKKIIDDLLDVIFVDNLFFQVAAKSLNNSPNVLNNCDIGGNMEWIVIATALTLVGVYYKLVTSKQEDEKVQEPELKEAIPADLCLVIPASIASNLKNGSNLNFDQLIDIINGASYFLCTRDVKSKVKLNTTNEVPLSDSKREVYIKININDGRNVINKKTRYSLKENLSENVQGYIEELKCLMDLSGLEEFNRI